MIDIHRPMPDPSDRPLIRGVAFDLDVFLEPLAQTVPPGTRREALCAAIARRFDSLVVAGRIPTCS